MTNDIKELRGVIIIKHTDKAITTWVFGVEEEYETACAIAQKSKLTFDNWRYGQVSDFTKERLIQNSEGFNDSQELQTCLVERGEYITDPEIEKAIAAIETRLSNDEHPQKCWRDVKWYLAQIQR